MIQHGDTAWPYSMAIQHGDTAWWYNMVIQYGDTAWQYSLVIQHGDQSKEVTPRWKFPWLKCRKWIGPTSCSALRGGWVIRMAPL